MMWLINQTFDSGPEQAEPAVPTSFTVPAQGDAYEFTVAIYCTRNVAGRRRINWRGLEYDEEVEQVGEIIRDSVRRTARNFSIFEGGLAEQAINDELRQHLIIKLRSGPTDTPTWIVRAELSVPEEVRATVRAAQQQHYKIEMRAREAALQLAKMNELRLRWDEFLADTAGDPTTRHAVQLAEDPRNVAQVLEAIQTERREGTQDLLLMIAKIAEAQRSADILGLVVNSETVLRKTLKLVGIEPPPLDPDTALIPDEASL